MKQAIGWLLAARYRAVLVTIALLMLLDLGRSIYARLGYAHPVETWQPDPKIYADITWPPGFDLSENTQRDARIYAHRCSVCHGPDGRGNGPAAPSLIPRPRDFTSGQFKYKSTPAGLPPSDADMIRAVSNGLNASAMPYFHDLLSDSDIRQVIAYIKNFSPVFGLTTLRTLAIPPRAQSNADSLARGQKLSHAQGCENCHGKDARGGLTLTDAKGYPVVSRDLTAPWTFRGGSDPEQIWLRLTTGMAPSPMPSLSGKITPEERRDIVNYVLSLARTPPWEPGGKLAGAGQQSDLTRRGEYFVRAEMCGLCHTMINHTGIYRADDFYLAGGMRVGAYPHGVMVSRNLTGDLETGLGNWSDDKIVQALRNGRSHGRVLNMYAMPWTFLHSLDVDDAIAIAKYLKTLTPVHNQIPRPLHYGVIETIVGKLTRPLPGVTPTVLTYADQRFGQRRGPSRDWPQTWMISAQWCVLLVGAVAFVFAAPRERRFPKTVRGWVGVVLAITGTLLLGAIGAAIYNLPFLTVIPPEQVTISATARIPKPDPALIKSPERDALVDRGRYIFTISSCAMCHRSDGSGGWKISWKPMGTLWTRNITADMQTGLGDWSDAEISRAIRSGVSRDGYQLHWQGMTWDHASNWDEEDIRAVISYLRVLPPVKNKILADRPPATDDCGVYTFWITENHSAGCR